MILWLMMISSGFFKREQQLGMGGEKGILMNK
jgi:hypothetical protein